MPKPGAFDEAMKRALVGVAPTFLILVETASTNDDAKARARAGAKHLTTVVADVQTAGRGRRGRTWTAAAGESLLASFVIRPALPADRWTVLPLVVGVACAEAVRARTGVEAVLKWPNDVLVAGRKLGGILVEAEPPSYAVAGVGINVSQQAFPDELRELATSVALEGGTRLDRADLLAAILRTFEQRLADVDDALDRYRRRCSTLGSRVRVERAGADPIEGVARDVDEDGALLVDGDRISAGDVHHVR